MLLFSLCTILYSQDDRRSRRRSRNARVSTEIVDSLKLKSSVGGQTANPDTTLSPLTDSLSAGADSIAPVDSALWRRDSTMRADSTFRADSLALLEKSSLDLPAFSGAKDSIVEVFSDGQRKIFYYGDVSVKYQGMELTADYMEYDLNTNDVFAKGTYDAEKDEWIGQPKMTMGKDTYEMETIRYNFGSRKARIYNMTTNEQEAILHGKNIKMMNDRSINIKNGQYTVCDADHPHYYVALSSAKVQPSKDGNKIMFGPAWPVFEDVPLPLCIPFGFVPKKPERATGLLMPSFGEETSRGFYMRDAGMYFVFGQHFDLSLTGDIYSMGSWAINLNSRYKVNYKFNGNVGLTYSVDQTGEKGSPDFFQTKNFSVKWSHSQDSKAHPGQTFSASVNFSSPSNSKYNSTSVTEALQNQISSSISFAKNWNGKLNLSINALHSQNSRDSSYTFTLPNVTFSVSTLYPFKRKVRVGKERFYEKISFGYNTSLQNKISFKASEFGEDGFLNRFQNGMQHNFSIGLPSFSLFNYLNFTPSVSYGQNWFFKKSTYQYNPETNAVEQQEGNQFSAFGITQNYSGSISMSTRLYGMFNFGSYRKIQAIRHVISPSLSMSFSPEKGTYANGYRTLYYTDRNGEDKEYQYNIYAGQLYSAPGKGKSATASLSIGNNFEAKVRDFADTSGTATKKVKLIDQLNFSTGYNFLADSMKMNTISVSASTSIFGKLSISGSASLDPYAIDEKGRRYNRYNFQTQGWSHPLRLTNASLSMSYSLSGEGHKEGNDGGQPSGSPSDYYIRYYNHPVTGEYIPGGWLYYTNPNVPWSVNMSYSFSYSKSYSYSNAVLSVKNKYTQTLNLSGNLKLTPRMNLQANANFDIMAMKMTTTQISATYDLHCFNISVSWVPTGTWQSYSFRIAANASALADLLKFKKTSSYWDN